MNRINVTERTDDGSRRLIGWFDAEAAEVFAERREAFDGANLAGVHMRDQDGGQRLYLTRGGRWVLEQWSRWQGEADTYHYVGADAAREWLQINGDEEVIERLFGEPVPPESGPGRPEIGPVVTIRLPQDLIDRLDAEADRCDASRAEIIRTMLWQQLYTLRTGLPYTDRVDAGIGSDEEEGI